MDYTICWKEVIQQYSWIDPVVEFIRHNENITYKVTEQGSDHTYLMRLHKPITTNLQGVQTMREAIQSELEYLLAWSAHSELPVQIPVPNLKCDLVTSVVIESGGFIHADVHYSNLIRTSNGISFIDFGLSGFGYYTMDLAMGALFTKSERRDDLLAGYTSIISRKIDIVELEDLMFLNISECYAFLLSRQDKRMWIREHMPSLIELCKSVLNGKKVFYQINQVGLTTP